jgi:hypothetical protein
MYSMTFVLLCNVPKDDHDQLSTLKTEISNAIADVLTKEDIQCIPIIAEAIDGASK